MKRLYNLDYLRGIAAFGIMFYHYLSWSIRNFESESFFGRIGVYGVSIFYVLSGLTLYLVYKDKMEFNRKDIFNFYIKRFFRIFPLMWLVVIITIVLLGEAPNLYDLTLNLTGLFGFFNWDKYFAVGLWSIGNELVFYVFFISFLFFSIENKIIFLSYSLLIFIVYLFFAFYVFRESDSKGYNLNTMWKYYVNPLNQVFLFLSGFLIGYFFKNQNNYNKTNFTLLILGLVLFVFYPSQGDRIYLVSGYSRLVFTFAAILICYGFYQVKFDFHNLIHKPLVFLGEISYSLYLIHPIIFYRVRFVFDFISSHYFKVPLIFTLIVSILLTLLVSYWVYIYFEKFFIKLGNSKFSIK